MKGVILAGGTGSRLYPLTKVCNKHLLPVGEKPMIFWAIEKLVKANIKDILVVTGTEHMGNIVQVLGSGQEFDCEITYKVQEAATGIAAALKLAKGFVGNDPFACLLGDNIFEDDLINVYTDYNRSLILVKAVPNPQEYGCIKVTPNGILECIIEKPVNPPSDYAVTGIYFYTQEVFNIIDSLKPSARAELEITDLNNELLWREKLNWKEIKGAWIDAGTMPGYRSAQYLIQKIK